ncbi:hypothetical protein [Collimonas humicola]|uniref:hypothetical protein n=1 Tax=Collimonas humicola TaxID=2825886 RepID=UPI001B8C98D9|nr:hypothetical protein [Collimonas humicola]
MKTVDADALPSQPSSGIVVAMPAEKSEEFEAAHQSWLDNALDLRPEQEKSQAGIVSSGLPDPEIVHGESRYPDFAGCAGKAAAEPGDIRAILDHADAMSASVQYKKFLKSGPPGPTAARVPATSHEAAPSCNTQRRGGRAGSVNEPTPDYSVERGDPDLELPDDIFSAVFMVAGDDDEPVGEQKKKGREVRSGVHKEPATDRDRNIGSTVEDDDDFPGLSNEISRSAERMYYLAMVAAAGESLLRAPKMRAQNSVPALPPRSQADCQRRCGSDGFCDPSSALGCGGEHCGKLHFGM